VAFDAGAAVGRLTLDDSQYLKALKRSGKGNKSLGKTIFGAQLAYDAFKKVLTATTQTMVKSIKLATDFEEANSKLFTVFSGVAEEATSMRKNLVDNFGLSKKAATELLGATGDLLTGFGFSQQSALDLSNSVQELAVDLASFTNFSGGAEGASAALTKALLGERESVKSLGISILETDVQAKVLELTQQGLTFETERQAKAYATLLIAQEQSKNAIGDFARTQDSLANRQRQLLAVTEDLQIIFGQIMVPILNDMAGSALENGRAFRDFLESTEGIELLSTIFASISAGVQLLKIAFEEIANIVQVNVQNAFNNISESLGKLFEEASGNITAFDIFTGIMKGLGIGITVVVKFTSLLIQGFIDLVNVIKETGLLVSSFFEALSDPTQWGKFKDQLADTGDAYKDFGKNLAENTEDIVTTVIDEFKDFPKGVEDTSHIMEGVWNNSFLTTQEAYKKHLKQMADIQSEEGEELLTEQEKITKKLRDNFFKALPEAETFKEKFDLIKKAFKDGAISAGEAFAAGFEEIGKQVLGNIEFVGSKMAGLYNDIFGIVEQGLSQELDALKAQNEEKVALLETEKEERLTATEEDFSTQQEMLQEKLDNDLITQEEFDLQSAMLEQQKADTTAAIEAELDAKLAAQKQKNRDKENAKEKQLFEAQKANQIANIWIQAALGIVGAWAQSIAQLGPIGGAIFAGILTAAILGVAIAQTVVVSQQQFIPRKEKGGMASGLTMINEDGRGEIVNLPDGSLVIPNDISAQIARNTGNGGSKQIIINNSFKGAIIDSELSLSRITTSVSREMSRRIQLAEG
jgi:hypothetical protein